MESSLFVIINKNIVGVVYHSWVLKQLTDLLTSSYIYLINYKDYMVPNTLIILLLSFKSFRNFL